MPGFWEHLYTSLLPNIIMTQFFLFVIWLCVRFGFLFEEIRFCVVENHPLIKISERPPTVSLIQANLFWHFTSFGKIFFSTKKKTIPSLGPAWLWKSRIILTSSLLKLFHIFGLTALKISPLTFLSRSLCEFVCQIPRVSDKRGLYLLKISPHLYQGFDVPFISQTLYKDMRRCTMHI